MKGKSRWPDSAAPAPKYGSKTAMVDGERFDSKLEARIWTELSWRQRAGEISELKRQVPFPLVVNGQHVCLFRADFTYLEKGRLIVADAKSKATRRIERYRLKFRLFRAVMGFEILELGVS